MTAVPETTQFCAPVQAMSKKTGRGALAGSGSGAHVSPPSLEAATSLTLVVALPGAEP
jgi:hypothetical protein